MSARIIEKSVLLKTSSINDVQNGGGKLAITGLRPVPKVDITSIYQVKYRAEVAQVVTLFGTTYTPVASTVYKIAIYDQMRVDAGYTESPKYYTYTTPAVITTIGASAAIQSEYIHGQLIIAINNDATNHCSAVTVGSGNGITVTDDGGYYPARAQNMTNVKGANKVIPITNDDGTGFAATNYVITTAAVYSSGVGARLLQDAPVIDFTFGNLISGKFNAPSTFTNPTTYAVSGQNYDIFGISSLKLVAGTTLTEQYVYQIEEQIAVVDNGTGSSTTNLAGFIAFERQFRKDVGQFYQFDNNAMLDFFDSPTIFQGAAGAVPTATGENKAATAYGQWVYNMIGSGTITVPTPANTGLNLDLDAATTEGLEITPSLLTVNSQAFVVGQQEFSVTAKVIVTDHTDADLLVGFRKKAAHAADFNNYTDLGAVGFIADLVYTWGILNDAATVATNTTVVPTDAAYEEFVVKVAISGAVTCYRNGVAYPVYSVGTTPLVFDAGDTIIPFVRAVNNGGGDPDVIINQLLSVASTNWLS